MPIIRTTNIIGKSNLVEVEETLQVMANSTTIREAEKDRIRLIVEDLEQQILDLVNEYATFLEINNFVEPGTDPDSVIKHNPSSDLYEPDPLDGATYIDVSNLLTNNPAIPSQITLQEEMDDVLGKVSSEILRYQKDINKKYSLKRSLLKRLYYLDYRENAPADNPVDTNTNETVGV